MYNTSTLGYKLLSGSLRDKRKHSEQLNKYVAGLMDTDGCVSLFFYKTRAGGRQRVKVTLSLAQAANNDPDFSTIRALQSFYGLGSLSYQIPTDEEEVSICYWTMRDKDTRMMFNRIGKHMRLKASHFDNMIWISEQHSDIEDIPDCIVEELKEYRKCSLRNTTYLKMPKHLSYAYVAGVIAGDGSVGMTEMKDRNHPSMRVRVSQDRGDKLLALFKRDFRGGIYETTSGAYSWERNLGVNNASFAVPFLKKLRMYLIHERKYDTVCKILDYHEDHRQQRLSKGDPLRVSNSPDTTVFLQR